MADVFDFYIQDNRKITFEIAEPIMREDNGVTDFQFHVPKTLNGLDMTGWAWWFVFVNADKHKYTEPLVLTDDPERPLEYSVGTYTVDYGMSIKAGTVSFALEAINSDTGGTILNEWHTFTYQTTVKDTLQGNQVEYDETESDIISALLIEVQNKFNSLIGGATPEVKNSIADMTDRRKIYVLSTDKNWYFWSGSDWVPGGQYASGIVIDPTGTQSGMAADAKVVGDALINRSIPTDNAVDGKRVESGTGNVTDNVNFSYVEFSVIGGDVIEYKTQRAESGVGLAFYDGNGVYISGAQAVAGSQEISVPANATLARATYRTAQIANFSVIVCKSIEPVIDAVVGTMAKAESNSKNAENIGFSESATYNIVRRANIYPHKRLIGYNTSTYVPTFATDVNYFYADIALPENITEIIIPIPSSTPAYNYLVAYTENVKSLNTNYVKVVDGTSTMIAYVSIKSDGVHIKTKSLFDAGFARLAIEGLTADINSFSILCDKVSIPWAVASMPEIGQEKQYTGLNMFASVQCIGDSYTQGGIKSSNGSTWYQAKKPYPQIIADNLGIDVNNFGVGGATVKSYLTNGLTAVLSATAPDLYMICFGINDCLTGDTIGTIADINDSDYTQNADTFYGNYGRIIAQLKIHAPLARFVIFGRWLWDKSGQTFSNYSNAAEEIANHFGIPFVDPFNDPFFESYVYHYTMVSGHPTQVTYTGLAYAVMRLMAKCIEENETYYRYAGLEAV